VRSLTTLAVAGLAAAAVATAAAPAHAATARPLDSSGHFTSDGVNIWSGPGTGTVNGLGYNGQPITVHCGAVNGVGDVIYYDLTDDATGVSGYSYFLLITFSNPVPNC
jgi:hypothetical protein